jgi:NADPH:quinone reductase-like Zn-dependent oxidoreductase
MLMLPRVFKGNKLERVLESAPLLIKTFAFRAKIGLNSTEKHWRNMTEVIAPQGKICSIVEMQEPVDLTALQQKSVTFVWEWMFTRAFYQTSDMIEQHHLLNELGKLVDAGKIRTTLSERLEPITAANLRQAHKKVEMGRMMGKIVLEHFPA